jgi:hypothetical protein
MSKSLSPATKSPQNLIKGLVGIAALIFICGGALVFFLHTRLAAMESVAENKRGEVGTSEQVMRRYQLTLDTYNQTVSKIQYLEASVNQQAYVPTMLKQLQALANQTHLTVTAVRPAVVAPTVVPPPAAGTTPTASAKKKTPPPYDTLDITVEVKGTYQNTVAFMYDLTKFPKIVAVSSAQMHPGASDSVINPMGSPVVATSIHLTAYVFHDTANVDTPIIENASNSLGAAAGLTPASDVTLTNSNPMPPVASGTPAEAAGRAAAGALGATKAARDRSEVGVSTL